jgi:hypothetical protein
MQLGAMRLSAPCGVSIRTIARHGGNSMALPDRIPIRYIPDYRSWCIGRYDDGQFLGSVVSGYSKEYWAKVKRSGFGGDWPAHQRQYSVLHLFDQDGRHQSSDIWYAGTGQGEPVQHAFARLQERVDALPGRQYGDIAIRPFRVEFDDQVFALVDESDEERGDWAELYPNDWGFHPPWDSHYDT